ncbi:TetR/AcrR family transcriptional regulator [Actinoplanes friuliensis]|jgi:AcrR family transcriptional regulator|uniref:TetR family transcriptional regulator n=1 Tax=Actinoplanes friuliensis DSM 7358 TaxID=1246995 RepID=U5WBW4_9ACTN|nr:TetR/AcrR family transcriptional regulator [Actinoplanes friuliensis]AGZ45490.1 TetR family transcriptional regulator [Actinoplanes friuliensis DSM 7358]
MTTTTPSRRERLRAETVTEIKDAARRLLVAGGPTAISLRAIARDVGLTAPALYRYFDSLDALVLAIVTDLFEDLRTAIAATADHHADEEPLTRVAHMAREFRRWSLDHPAEFALMFGSPVPGVTQFAERCGPVNDAGARFGETFFTVLGEHLERHRYDAAVLDLPEVAQQELFKPYLDTFGDRFPLPVIYLFVAAWTRLYGIVAMEVFGHLRWAMTDVEPLFEVELARTIGQLAR